jgi:HSP20 family protein
MNIVTWQRPILNNWPGFGRGSELRDEIDRLFAAPVNGWTPALDVQEDPNNFIVSAELPGLKREAIELSLHEGNLSISGERKSEPKPENVEVSHAERSYGRFQRTISLPVPVAADKVKATYKDGVLTITVPKTEAAKPRQIAVSE